MSECIGSNQSNTGYWSEESGEVWCFQHWSEDHPWVCLGTAETAGEASDKFSDWCYSG